jgi:mycofactocin precursor
LARSAIIVHLAAVVGDRSVREEHPMPEQHATSSVAVESAADETVVVDAELLVEEVSIDGMCGVY